RGHAAPPQTRDRWHAGIVPTVHMSIANELGQYTLGQDRVSQVEPREFVLMRLRRYLQISNEPVVKRTMILEFEPADRRSDVLDRMRLPVRIGGAGIDLPRGAGAWMRRVKNPVHHRVAQIDVTRCHVNLGAQNARAVREFASPHAPEQVEVLFDTSIAERA